MCNGLFFARKVEDPDEDSGFGFEVTFRLKVAAKGETAPMWPASLLNSLARYVFKTGEIIIIIIIIILYSANASTECSVALEIVLVQVLL